MHASPASDAPAASTTPADLGPVLLEQRMTHGIGLLFVFGGALFAGLGGLAFVLPARGNAAVLQITGAVFAVVGLLYVAAGLHRIWTWRGAALFLHAGGIRRRRGGQESIIRFEDVREMRHASTRVLVHGSYAGTVENLSVRTGDRGEWLYFQRKIEEQTGLATGYRETSPVQQAAARVSALLAAGMARRLEAGQSVPWTSRMRLRPDGVELSRTRWYECEASDLVRRQPRWQFYPWDQIERTQIDQGVLFVWVKGQRTPRQRVVVSEVNFQPGYGLFATLPRARFAARLTNTRHRPCNCGPRIGPRT